MSIEEMFALLKTILVGGQPIEVAFDHFTSKNIQPPFIVFSVENVYTLKADDKVHYQENDYIVDLCNDVKNVELETQLETLFNDNYLPYDKECAYIDSEQMFQTRYFI